MVFDGIEVKEASGWNAGFLEYGEAGARLRVVREEPGGADGNDSRGGGDLGRNIFGEGGGKLRGSDDVGLKGHVSMLRYGCLAVFWDESL